MMAAAWGVAMGWGWGCRALDVVNRQHGTSWCGQGLRLGRSLVQLHLYSGIESAQAWTWARCGGLFFLIRRSQRCATMHVDSLGIKVSISSLL